MCMRMRRPPSSRYDDANRTTDQPNAPWLLLSVLCPSLLACGAVLPAVPGSSRYDDANATKQGQSTAPQASKQGKSTAPQASKQARKNRAQRAEQPRRVRLVGCSGAVLACLRRCTLSLLGCGAVLFLPCLLAALCLSFSSLPLCPCLRLRPSLLAALCFLAGLPSLLGHTVCRRRWVLSGVPSLCVSACRCWTWPSSRGSWGRT
jgi:hypothetical protein